jgi:hypothetical protein
MWRLVAAAEQTGRMFDQAFSDWIAGQRRRTLLLRGSRLRNVVRYREQLHWSTDHEGKEKFLQQSLRWRNRRYVNMSVALVLLCGAGYQVWILMEASYRERQWISELQALNVGVVGEGEERTAYLCKDENASEGAQGNEVPYFCVGNHNGDLARAAPLIAAAKISKLNLVHTSVTDLEPLRGITSPRELDISDNKELDSLIPIGTLTNLEVLEAWGTGVHDLTPLIGLKHLRKLSVQSVSTEDLPTLLKLPSLKELSANTDDATRKILQAHGIEVK